MALPRELTTVTFVSTTLSIVAFLIIPFIAFFSGVDYQKFVTPIGLADSETTYGSYYSLPTSLRTLTSSPTVSVSPAIPSAESPVFVEENTSIPNQKKYSSAKLGISFLYQYKYSDSSVITKTVGDRIYVASNNNKPEAGQYVEIFQKDPQITLAQAIQEKFLTGTSDKDCYIGKDNNPHSSYPATYQTAVIDYNHTAEPNSNNPWQGSEKCPTPYTLVNGIAYFLMDSAHPDKFLFFNIGQYGIQSGNGNSTWQDTVTFL